MTRRLYLGSVLRLAVVAVILPGAAGAEVRIEVNPPPRAGSAGTATIEVLGAGDFRLGGGRVRAWLVPGSAAECTVPGPLSGRIEIGGRLLLVRHEDGTVSAVNPERSLASGNIAWMTRYGFPATGWRIDERQGVLLVRGADAAGTATIRLADGQRVGTNEAIEESRGERAADAGQHPSAQRSVRSSWAQAAFALDADGRTVAIDLLDGRQAPVPIDLPIAAKGLLLAPDERWLFALDGAGGFVMVIDVARRRLSRILQINAGIGAAAFSDNYLYLREARAPYASLLRLASLDTAREHVARIPVGLAPSSDTMARLGGDGMAFLNAAERTAYLYMESGMADNHGTMRSPTEMLAPYAAVPLRGGRPTALLAYDRGLRETGAGQYAASFSVPRPGIWQLVARASDDEAVACARFVVPGAPERDAPHAFVLASADGNSSAILLKGPDGRPAASGPARFELLALRPGRNWQMALSAIREQDGHYRLSLPIPGDDPVTLVPLGPSGITGTLEWKAR